MSEFSSRDRHLTDEELDAMVMGVEDADEHTAHMMECVECRAKLVEMRAMVDSFREGVLLWSEKTTAKATTGVLPLRLTTFAQGQDDGSKKYGWGMVPAMGLAAMLVVGVMTPHWIEKHRASEAVAKTAAGASIAPLSQKQDMGHPEQQAAVAPTDDALMQQVQQQLDEDVPSSMAPLTALIQTEDPHKAARQTKEN
jgi:hypothetical protein